MDSWDITSVVKPYHDVMNEGDVENEEHICQVEEDNLEWHLLCQLTCASIWEYYEKYIHKVPYHTSTRSGHKLIHEIMAGNETQCYQAFRMTRTVFIDFCLDLQHNYVLNPTRGMSIYKELGIFLMTCAHSVEMFNHSGEIVHRHFHRVLGVINKLVEDIIKPHPHYNDGVGYHMPQNKKYLPFFKNCIGAIDGTHIKARLPRGEEIPYIGRKGYPTQNVLAIVDFNIRFTFEQRKTIKSLEKLYYYLIDAGCGNKTGYLAPYKGENICYHLEDFFRARTRQLRQPRGVKKKFNFLHSSCKNIIERDMPYYPINVQTEIVFTTMAIHNYIHQRGAVDNGFEIARNETSSI
ncbi:hypothetical protein RJ641_031527 [Dillenia turbinata]|uniref:DUF8040 domain-containing protein n=1 Tax=Dillenia turbinata TaxID=194707 RepID=A0AAN8VQ84_9MAGN